MRIALYMENGIDQVILTPDTDKEKAILASVFNSKSELSVKHGSFYECQGGFVRQGLDKTSTILVLKRPRGGAE